MGAAKSEYTSGRQQRPPTCDGNRKWITTMTTSTTIAWFAYLCSSCCCCIPGCVGDIGCSDVGVGVGVVVVVVGTVGVVGMAVVGCMGCCGVVEQTARTVHDAWELDIDCDVLMCLCSWSCIEGFWWYIREMGEEEVKIDHW